MMVMKDTTSIRSRVRENAESLPKRLFIRRLTTAATFAFLVFNLSFLAPTAHAQPGDPMIYTIGLTVETNGQHWAYLHWRSTVLDAFTPRVWSVWRKDGNPQDPGDFTLEALVRVQTSPSAIGALFDRARLVLGEDTDATRTAMNELFEELIPDSSLSNAELASAIIQGVEYQPQFLEALQFAARTFPSLAMSLGTAHAVPIPSSGPVTFEIRDRPYANAPDEAVLGRVTVNAASPLILPAPATLRVAPPDPDRPATADLNVPLRWATPDPLRRLTLAQHGFNLWRVNKTFAEANNWPTTPPATATLLTEAAVGINVQRVNQTPILPGATLDAAQAQSNDHRTVFATDHASRFPGYPGAHTPPQNGDQYYYFVTARDLLGRDGQVSAGELGTFCSRMPPRVPRVLNVINEYVFTNTAQHNLRLRWEANPPEDDKETTAYAIYRWQSSGALMEFGGNPTNNLVAIVPHVQGQPVQSYLDNGPGAPSAPADYAKTFWYTVRAIDNSSNAAACAVAPFGGNVSGHSPPVYGVLRDRYGPGAPVGGLDILCPEGTITIKQLSPRTAGPDEAINANFINVEIVISRENLDPNLHWVEVDWGVGAARFPFGRFAFENDELVMTQRLTFIAGWAGLPIWLQAKVGLAGDDVKLSPQYDFNLPAPGLQVEVVSMAVGVRYETAFLDPTAGRRPCFAHTPPPQDIGGGTNDGITIKFFPPPDMTQYKLYYRVDDGPLTLLREESGKFPTNTSITNLWLSSPLFGEESCFFVQVFDRHGNPSPLKPLGCIGLSFKFEPPAPMLAPIRPVGDESNALARITWFAPRWGTRNFEVHIAGLPLIPDGTVSNLVYLDRVVAYPVSYRRYITTDLRNGFGSGSRFQLELPIDLNDSFNVRVRGLTVSGGQTKLSNRETFTWTPPEVYEFPNVPWPVRGGPPVRNASDFHPRIIAEVNPIHGGGMVRIGEVVGRIAYNLTNDQFLITTVPAEDPLNRVYNRLGEGTPRRIAPFILYRTQLPSTEYPEVPGDVYQVSPLMEMIAWAGIANGYSIYDPYIYIKDPVGASATPTDPGYMYLMDTQPGVSRSVYRYLLVLLDPVTREVEEILVTNDVTF